ncbi:MAG: DNA polymerase I [Saprospiraceae bacterium]|jgi:DNA polymerase-1|nr:DNA polymerase I [Saprospiraceae bacterium]MBK7606770.1 DNA polymerase I [Saprospiraceae bacterium]MBK8283058.1 DNA polymerase I [Saprospiraceae bacterium]MBK8512911.1 DNA polymerase I [Saprospiraceae bacterium]MBK8775957.1 DNA polymerase I [Saprospiraceae bacterium]
MSKKLFLLDAYALIYRAYYAFIRTPIVNSKGFNTSAIYGFTITLMEVLEKQKPTHIAVVFDHPSQTLREQEYSNYKANREETPQPIKDANPWIRDIIKGMNIPYYDMEGYEADDIIATLAAKAAKEDFDVFIMTGDKDLAQCVNHKVKMYRPGKQGAPAEILGIEEVKEKFSIQDPLQIIDLLGLMGDAVDNIPGVSGVGEKTAVKLIEEFGSIENIYERIDEVKGKLKDKLLEGKENAFLSKRLATVVSDVAIDLDENALVMEAPNREVLSPIFAELEFRTIGKRLFGDEFSVNRKAAPSSTPTLFEDITEESDSMDDGIEAANTIANTPHTYHIAQNEAEHKSLVVLLLGQKEIAFDTETTGLDSIDTNVIGMSFSYQAHDAWFVPVPIDFDQAKEIVLRFKPVLESETITKIGHNIKFDWQVIRQYGVEIKAPFYDTMVAHYLIDANQRHKMDFLAETYLQYTPVPIEALIGKAGKRQKSMSEVALKEIAEYAAEDADVTFRFKKVFDPLLSQKELTKLYHEVELPLVETLQEMEWQGVQVDAVFLKEYSDQLGVELTEIKEKIFEQVGAQFNLDSPKQMGEILFDRMKIPYTGPKTKTGQYQTNEDTLSKLADAHPIIDAIVNYRELAKLKSTYVDSIPALINHRTGRLHTTFNQTIAATGRLSSINPNLQNIPIRTDRGKEIRKAFIPRDAEHIILSADYSQIELRIIADISKDENMMAAFQAGEDIHTATASKVFNVPSAEVTKEMRRRAKAVNFGIAYGQSVFGLSQTLNISRGEAKEIIDNYFTQFPGIKQYMTDTIAFAKKHGYVQTLLGRRRYLPEINERNFTVRGQAERNAINSPIQGSAADMIKVAMVKLHERLKKEQFKSVMTLQVHDELVFDVLRTELERIKPVIEHEMKIAIPGLTVPIVVEMGSGDNWLDAH